MRRYWMGRGLRFLALGAAAVAVFGVVVMTLWNGLMPDLFGWRPIGFWQALGLLILTRLLFGGFRGGPGRHLRWRHRLRERWEQMTPEERERFREGMRGCGRPRPTEGAGV
jgi:Ca2+/H+ antiporter, TMEM165/GDT1 family